MTGRKYRSFAEVYPDEQFDVDAAWDSWLADDMDSWNQTFYDAFKAGWEAAEKKLMEVRGE